MVVSEVAVRLVFVQEQELFQLKALALDTALLLLLPLSWRE
jgi:hypothetical protein